MTGSASEQMNEMNGNGKSSSPDAAPSGLRASLSGNAPGSLASRVRRVDLPGDYMYPPATRAPGSVALSTSPHTQGNGDLKHKGKQRAELEPRTNPAESSAVAHDIGGLKGTHTPAKREEFVRLMLQALRDVGYKSVSSAIFGAGSPLKRA